jgi:translation elongation factor EF-1beta
MSRKDDIKKLLSNKVRRLQKLKEQQSVFGISTNPEILIEIEDLEGEIEELEKQLQPNEVEGPGDTNGGFDTPERNDRVFPCLARIYAKLRSPKLLYLGMGLVVVLLLIAGCTFFDSQINLQYILCSSKYL